jgi:hypothetical protein
MKAKQPDLEYERPEHPLRQLALDCNEFSATAIEA